MDSDFWIILLCVDVHTAACRRQVVYAVPTHLHAEESYRKQPSERRSAAFAVEPQVEVEQIDAPRDCRPGLFGVPAPELSPCRFCPQGAAHHAQCQEGGADIDQPVCRGQVTVGVPDLSCQGKEKGASQNGVGEDIDRDMWHEPWTLQGRHQRPVVYFGLQQVDEDKYQRKEDREE